MAEKRIIFDNANQRKLFDFLLSYQGLSLKRLSKELDVGYWTLKNWRNGKFSLPRPIFDKIRRKFPFLRTKIKKLKFKVVEGNWGRGKGGKVANSRLSRSELNKKMEKVRSKKKSMRRIDWQTRKFYEFYGILMGDGCLSCFYSKSEGMMRHEVRITGHKKHDFEYFENYVLPMISELTGFSPSVRFRKNSDTIDIAIRSRVLFDFLAEQNDFPVGKKGQISVPEKFLDKGWGHTKYLVRGLFDTDGCYFARKDERYRYPYIGIYSQSNKLLNQLKEILNTAGFPAYIHAHGLLIRGKNNARRWMREIGASNVKHLRRVQEFSEKAGEGTRGLVV